jgi:type I restriction enzyme S subunit
MKGLDITVLSTAKVAERNPSFRIDADYFRKQFLSMPEFDGKLGEIALVRSGSTPPDRDDQLKSGTVLLKTTDIRNSVLPIEHEGYYKISADIAKRMLKTSLRGRDVLINIVGATTDVIGRVAFVPEGFPDSNITQAMALIRVLDAHFEPASVFAFLAGKYGQLQVRRLARPTGQYNLNLQEVSSLSVPRFSPLMNSSIAQVISDSQSCRSDMTVGFSRAEATMLTALGMKKWHPFEPLTYSQRASEAFAANRIDAEFFHPTKKAFIDRLAALPGRLLGSHCYTVREMFDPRLARSNEVVRNFDLTDALEPVLDDEHSLTLSSRIGSLKKQFVAGDVVISRLRSYLREIAVVRTTSSVRAVGSSEFIILRPFSIQNPPLSQGTLLIFLRSLPVQTILKWSQDGSNHPRFSEEHLMSISVPDVVCNIAPKIEELFEGVLVARARAKELLARATRAVELAIEKSEKEALQFLQ